MGLHVPVLLILLGTDKCNRSRHAGYENQKEEEEFLEGISRNDRKRPASFRNSLPGIRYTEQHQLRTPYHEHQTP